MKLIELIFFTRVQCPACQLQPIKYFLGQLPQVLNPELERKNSFERNLWHKIEARAEIVKFIFGIPLIFENFR